MTAGGARRSPHIVCLVGWLFGSFKVWPTFFELATISPVARFRNFGMRLYC